MSAPPPDPRRATMPRLRPRDLMSWFLGVSTAVTVNRVSNLDDDYPTVILAALLVTGAIGGTLLLRTVAESSLLRQYAPDVLLSLAAIPAVLAFAGVGADHTMLVAATLVAVSALVTPGDRTAVTVRLFGASAAAAGVVMMTILFRSPPEPIVNRALLGFYASVGTVAGVVLVVMSRRLARWMEGPDGSVVQQRVASLQLFLGVLSAAGTVVVVMGLLGTPGGAAVAIVGAGMSIALLRDSLGTVLTAERRERLGRHWGELCRPRKAGETRPSYRELLTRLRAGVRSALARFDAAAQTMGRPRRARGHDLGQPGKRPGTRSSATASGNETRR